MKTIDTHGSFEDAISNSSDAVKKIAVQLRNLIADLYPAAVEVPWPKQGVIGYGVGPKKISEHFCYIATQRDYVNLGFYYGVDLPDPHSLLEGSGKKLRHVKVHELADVDRLEISQLIRSSIEERANALGLEN